MAQGRVPSPIYVCLWVLAMIIRAVLMKWFIFTGPVLPNEAWQPVQYTGIRMLWKMYSSYYSQSIFLKNLIKIDVIVDTLRVF